MKKLTNKFFKKVMCDGLHLFFFFREENYLTRPLPRELDFMKNEKIITHFIKSLISFSTILKKKGSLIFREGCES